MPHLEVDLDVTERAGFLVSIEDEPDASGLRSDRSMVSMIGELLDDLADLFLAWRSLGVTPTPAGQLEDESQIVDHFVQGLGDSSRGLGFHNSSSIRTYVTDDHSHERQVASLGCGRLGWQP